MQFADLLSLRKIDPRDVVIYRHSPDEPRLRAALPALAQHDRLLFETYQRAHNPSVEASLRKARYFASFVAVDGEATVFAGLYRIGDATPLTPAQFWEIEANQRLRLSYGMKDFSEKNPGRTHIQFFELSATDFYSEWIGRLCIKWPPGRNAVRRAERPIDIVAVSRENLFEAAMPDWRELVLTCSELGALRPGWRAKLEEWRGVYLIFDASDGKGYVGSASGADNLYGRWRAYGNTGHGENKLLRERDHANFRFSIFELLNHDTDPNEVLDRERLWKKRLHTRAPLGLNAN